MSGGETREIRLRRLRLRSWRRGIREMDLILGGFADAAPGRAGRRNFSTLLTCYCRKTIMTSIGGSPETQALQRGTRTSSEEYAAGAGTG